MSTIERRTSSSSIKRTARSSRTPVSSRSRTSPSGRDGRRMTADDYFAMPNDGKLYELIDGALIMSPSPIQKHQIAARKLLVILNQWVETNGEGRVEMAPFDYRVDDFNVVQPDILWIPKSHPQYADVENVISGPLGLVVEVLSPGGGSRDYHRKFEMYEKAGVQNYWIVDPIGETIEAWVLKKGAYVAVEGSAKGRAFSAPPFVKLSIDLEKLFAWP